VRAVVFTGTGGNEVVEIQERADPELGPHDVLVHVAFAGMNPADVEQREGRYPAPPGTVADIPGLEVAGTVAAVGERVTSWQADDRVFGLVSGGGLADRVAVHERWVVAIPDALDERAAAAVPEAFITAHDALRQGSVTDGCSVLIRGATGAVGSAGVQIARELGATVFTPVGTDDEGSAMRALGAVAVPASDFQEAVMGRTGGKGVDVVVDLVGGDGVATELAALALGGRVVVVSTAGGPTVELDLRRLMGRRASIRGTVLRSRTIQEKADVVRAFGEEIVPMFADGRVRPSIDGVYPVDEIGDAFDRLRERGKRGKVLVRFA
jgi:NADPH2:quinone reductase